MDGLLRSDSLAILFVVKVVNLEAALNKRPFRPFEIRVDGEVIRVVHPEQTLFAEKKSTLIVVDANDHMHIFDVDQISKLRLLSRRAPDLQRSAS